MANKVWYDIHSHFLPGMDDGCKTVAESVKLLEHVRRSGIKGIIATPHYYPEESIAQFLERRSVCARNLIREIEEGGHEVPLWCMGAEVAYYEGVIRADDLEKLCLGQSRYLLLELPFERWNNAVIRTVYELSSIYNIMPVIAHLERYLDFVGRDMLEDLYETDALIQMNGGYILNKKRDARKRIRKGLVQVLGSDTHNMTSRRPNLREAVNTLQSLGLEREAEELRTANKEIFYAALGQNK